MANEKSVREVMTANPECLTADATISDAARIMKNQDTGVVPVLDGKKIIGMITDRDIVVRGIAEGRDLAGTRVNELMSKSVRTVREGASLDEVIQLMSSAEIRRVPVVNDSDELVGIVSIGDVSSQGNQDSQVGRAMEQISEAPPNN